MRNLLQTAALSRRVVCRTLTVVGGAAAGTALAWALSAASASADVQTPVGDVPVAIQEVVEPVAEPVELVVDPVVRDPAPPTASLVDLREQVEDAYRAESLPELPVCAVCAEPRDVPTESVDRSAAPALSPVVQALAPVTMASTAIVDAAPATAKERAFADGMSRRAGPALGQPALPHLPEWPAPVPTTPAGIPTAGGQAPTGNIADSPLFAALPWGDNGTDLVAGGMAAATDTPIPGQLGAQPGVAPD